MPDGDKKFELSDYLRRQEKEEKEIKAFLAGEFFVVSEQIVNKWRKEGMPFTKDNKDNYFINEIYPYKATKINNKAAKTISTNELKHSRKQKTMEPSTPGSPEGIEALTEQRDGEAVTSGSSGDSEAAPEPQNVENAITSSPDIVETLPEPMKREAIIQNDMDSDESLIKRYHEQALFQAHVQFWAGLSSAAIGFTFIIFMISSLKTTTDPKWYEYVVNSLPGAIIALVSALFFNQVQSTRTRATDLFEKLNYQKQILRSVTIAESIKNDNLRDQTMHKISLRIIGLNTNNMLEKSSKTNDDSKDGISKDKDDN
ncbi:MAG: hypothetical protein FWH55_02605 [Oscillospiraceae bacterium]|nr:hypothetical protein [Oscillospiraceae bacterium]